MILDDLKKYEQLDKHFVGKSMELLPDQIRQALEESNKVQIPKEYSQVKNIVFNGMGGSNLGAHLIKSALAKELKVPFNIEPGYDVPAYVDENTLYIIASYSGTTEEPLSVYKEVKKRGAKIIALTEDNSNSQLYKLMMKENIPGYIFRAEKNPSGQPRLGTGYPITGALALLDKLGFIHLQKKEMKLIIDKMEIWGRKLRPESNIAGNAAKKLAQQVWGRVPVVVGAEFLAGNLHIMRNQVNECSKQFMTYLILPDMNHYAMEGLSFPEENKDNIVFLFFDSKLYNPRIQLRSKLTKKVVQKNGINAFSYELKGETKLMQAFELLQLGSWLSYYLGVLNEVDPVKIPWVDWFKKQLK